MHELLVSDQNRLNSKLPLSYKEDFFFYLKVLAFSYKKRVFIPKTPE